MRIVAWNSINAYVEIILKNSFLEPYNCVQFIYIRSEYLKPYNNMQIIFIKKSYLKQ